MRHGWLTMMAWERIRVSARTGILLCAIAAAGRSPAASPPFSIQRVELTGRLRHLTLQDVWEGGGVEAVVLEREGQYPDWRIALSVWGTSTIRGEIALRARIALPNDTVFYGFVPLAGTPRRGLVVVTPQRIELWPPATNGWEQHDGPSLPFDGALPGAEPGDAAPLDPIPRDWPAGAPVDILVPARGGIAGFSVTRSEIRQTRLLEAPPRVRARVAADRMPLEPSFWFRGQLWFPPVVPGSLTGGSADTLFLPWHDEVLALSANGGAGRVLRFGQLTDAERDDGQSYVLTLPEDLDADGRTDFLVNKFQGVATSLRAETTIFMTRTDGTVPATGLTLRPQGNRAAGVLAVDLDRDGKKELVAVSSQFNAWAVVRALLTRKITVTFTFYSPRGGTYRADAPDYSIDLSFGFDLGDADIAGILPSLEGDFNGDGYPDAVFATDRETLKVIVQRPRLVEPFASSATAQISVPVGRTLRVGDLDGDGRSDVVLYDSRAEGNRTVRFLINCGTLK